MVVVVVVVVIVVDLLGLAFDELFLDHGHVDDLVGAVDHVDDGCVWLLLCWL